MANFSPSRLGLVNNTGTGYDDLFLKVWSGEVLSAFRKATIFEPLHTVRTIQSGKSAQFPIIGLATTSYHAVGTQLTGSAIKHAEATINIDDKLVSQVFLADIEEAKNHYDVRSRYTAEMGNALAYRFDQNVAATIAQAARTATDFNTDLAGGTRVKILKSGTANTAAAVAAVTGADLVTALWTVAQTFDENNIPENNTHIREGEPEEVITQIAHDLDADVVLVGILSEADIQSVILGSTIEHVMDSTQSDVLAIKPQDGVKEIEEE